MSFDRVWCDWHEKSFFIGAAILADYHNQACQLCLIPIRWGGELLLDLYLLLDLEIEVFKGHDKLY